MKILISGGTGLIGGYLRPYLEARGHEVWTLTRAPGKKGLEIGWDPEGNAIDIDRIAGFDAVVHLAGENLADGRWSDAKKQRIIDSREKGTSLLASALAGVSPRPAVFVSASGAGYYPAEGVHDERSGPGTSFLSEVCVRWEAAAEPARAAGIRVVHPRVGVVLSERGGALAKMLPPFKAGLGGPVGSGQQKLSWIHPADLVEAFRQMLEDSRYSGPVNVVAPEPVTNQDFTRALGSALNRPAGMKIPQLAIKAMFGEMGEETVLANNAALPGRLRELGFSWSFPKLDGALRDLLA